MTHIDLTATLVLLRSAAAWLYTYGMFFDRTLALIVTGGGSIQGKNKYYVRGKKIIIIVTVVVDSSSSLHKSETLKNHS